MSVSDEVLAACGGCPPSEVEEACALFAAGEYVTCHEVLEAVWRAEQGPLREFYRGLIQVAVGMHHARRGNWVGARNVLARGLARLERYAPNCLGYDVAVLCQMGRAYLAWLREPGVSEEPPPPVWRHRDDGHEATKR